MFFADTTPLTIDETRLVRHLARMAGVAVVGTVADAVGLDLPTTARMIADLDRRGVLHRHADWHRPMLAIAAVPAAQLRDVSIGVEVTHHGRGLIAPPAAVRYLRCRTSGRRSRPARG